MAKEIRRQMSESRKRLLKVKAQNSSVDSNARSKIRGQRSDVTSQRSELDDFRMKEEGSLIILPSIAPTSWHFSTNFAYSVFSKHPQSHAKSSHVLVSAFSPSASVSLLTKCASYLRFAQASRRFVQTDRDGRRIWSTSEYFSSGGNPLLTLKMSIASAYAF
jgi:hypothetical protein